MAPPPTCSGYLRKTFTPPGSNTKRGIWPKRWLSLKQIAGGGLALVWSPSEGAPPTGHLTITKKSLVSVPKSKQIRVTTPGDTAPAGTLLLQAGSAEEHVRWLDAIDKLNDAVKSGQIRKLTGNDYTDDMARGDSVVSIGWSGDAVQLQADNSDIEFVMPDTGCILWSDNMVVPVGAPNPDAAYAFMDYVYVPENQAQIAEYNNYITPVKGVQEIFEKTDPSLAKSELIFPTEEYTANCSTQTNPPADGTEEVEDAWQQLISGG